MGRNVVPYQWRFFDDEERRRIDAKKLSRESESLINSLRLLTWVMAIIFRNNSKGDRHTDFCIQLRNYQILRQSLWALASIHLARHGLLKPVWRITSSCLCISPLSSVQMYKISLSVGYIYRWDHWDVSWYGSTFVRVTISKLIITTKQQGPRLERTPCINNHKNT